MKAKWRAQSFSLISPHLPLGKAAKIMLKTFSVHLLTCSVLKGESQVGSCRGRRVGKKRQGLGRHLGKKKVSQLGIARS